MEYIERFETPIKSFIAIFRSTYKYCLAVGLSHEDIEQECYTGLIIAAKKFKDGMVGRSGNIVLFSAYAKYWIRQAATRAAWKYSIERGRPRKFKILSGDCTYQHDKTTTTFFELCGISTKPTECGMEENDHQRFLRQQIVDRLKRIPLRYREIICTRFGLVDGHPKSLGETGKIYVVRRQRIKQIETIVFNKIREPLRQATEHLLDA